MSASTTPSTLSPPRRPTTDDEGQEGSAVSHQAAAIAVELVRRAVQAHLPFRAVVADSFSGEDRGVKQGLRADGAWAMC